jgi:two-component system cell cycle sensor histidine kinase/response regulator CckA
MNGLMKSQEELLEEIANLQARVEETERRHKECESAKEALSEKEEKFRLVTETIQDVFYMVTPGHQKMLYISPGYEKIWGRTRESLYNNPRSFLDCIHPDDRPSVEKEMTDPKKDIEYRIIRPDGSVRWIRSRAFPIVDERGNVVKLTGVATDITDLKEKIAQLKDAESLSAIGRMVAFVAHEVRNPLQIIQSGVETLEQMPQKDLQREILEELRLGVEVLNNTIRQLLDFARRPELEIGPERVQEVVNYSLRSIERKLKGIHLNTRYVPEQANILVDKEKFAQVLINVVQNAVEAMPSGGNISITSNLFEQDGEKRARITVADSGCGIPQETLERMSEPFFTTKLGGIGLGLSICRKITQAHGGSINIKSKENEGTIVEIVLPAQ